MSCVCPMDHVLCVPNGSCPRYAPNDSRPMCAQRLMSHLCPMAHVLCVPNYSCPVCAQWLLSHVCPMALVPCVPNYSCPVCAQWLMSHLCPMTHVPCVPNDSCPVCAQWLIVVIFCILHCCFCDRYRDDEEGNGGRDSLPAPCQPGNAGGSRGNRDVLGREGNPPALLLFHLVYSSIKGTKSILSS